MANKLEPKDIEWKFLSSMQFTDAHHSKFINEEYGLEMEKIARKKRNGDVGNEKTIISLQKIKNTGI